MKGYKILNADYRSYPCAFALPNKYKQYGPSGIFEEYVEPKVCVIGMHGATRLVQCISSRIFTDKSKVVEVEAIGDVSVGIEHEYYGVVFATNRLKVIREIPNEEVWQILVSELHEWVMQTNDIKSIECDFYIYLTSEEERSYFSRLSTFDAEEFKRQTGFEFRIKD